jgi:hypothetical protein
MSIELQHERWLEIQTSDLPIDGGHRNNHVVMIERAI